MGVKMLVILCLSLLLSATTCEDTTNDLFCQLGKQLNKDMSSFSCHKNDITALLKEFMDNMEGESKKNSLENQLKTLMKNIGNTAEIDIYQKLKKVFQQEPTNERSILEIFQALLKINNKKDESKSVVDILSMILNALMANSQTVGNQKERDLLAMILKVVENHLSSSSPPAAAAADQSLDLFAKVLLESASASNPEMLMDLLHKLLTYRAMLKPWEMKFILEFRQLISGSIKSSIMSVVLEKVKQNERPLDIAKSLLMLLPQNDQLKGKQMIMKYEKEETDLNNQYGDMTNGEMMKMIRDQLSEINRKHTKEEGIMDLLKLPVWKRVFINQQEYRMFQDMTVVLEASYGSNSYKWFNGMLNWMDKEVWPRDLLKRILQMVIKNENVKASIVKSIMADKEISDFFYKVSLWMQVQDFSKSSPEIQMIHQIISSIKFPSHYKEEKWIEGFFNWLDDNFDDSKKWMATVKTISSAMVNKTWALSLIKEMDKEKGIRVLISSGKVICNRSVSLGKRSVQDILMATIGTKDLCAFKRINFFSRASVVNEKKKGKYIHQINDIPEDDHYKWIVFIKKHGKTVLRDVDVSYIPQNMEDIHVMYLNRKSIA